MISRGFSLRRRDHLVLNDGRPKKLELKLLLHAARNDQDAGPGRHHRRRRSPVTAAAAGGRDRRGAGSAVASVRIM